MARVPRTDDAALTRVATRGARGGSAGVALAAALVALAGCGSAPPGHLPPAATAAVSPPSTERPAGSVRRVGGHPQDIVVDPATHIASITFAGASALRQVRLPSLKDLPGSEAHLAATAPGTVAALRDGSLLAVLRPRERVLEIHDAATMRRVSNAPAGVGPSRVVCAPQGPCFVLDTDGLALLVMRVGAGGRDLRLTRRVYLAGSPYGVALDPTHDRTRLWITLPDRNQLVELPAQGRPHVLSRRPTVRQPNAVAVDPSTGDVVVAGQADGELQLLVDPAAPNR